MKKIATLATIAFAISNFGAVAAEQIDGDAYEPAQTYYESGIADLREAHQVGFFGDRAPVDGYESGMVETRKSGIADLREAHRTGSFPVSVR